MRASACTDEKPADRKIRRTHRRRQWIAKRLGGLDLQRPDESSLVPLRWPDDIERGLSISDAAPGIVGKKLTWKLTFSGLTGKATAAHIHMGAMGKAGNVLIPLCGPCKSGAHGKAEFTAAMKKALTHHKLYVDVHTAMNPNGEIRGQLAKM